MKIVKEEISILKSVINAVNIPFTGSQFNGIISHLGHGNPRNVCDEGTVEITASSICDDNESRLTWIVQYDNNNCFYSKDVENSWVMFDFKNKKVKLSHYSIQTNPHGDVGHWHLQNWCIEGSNDNSGWKPLDTRNNDKSLDHKSASNTFQVQNKANSGYYKLIRLRQTDVNTQGNHAILFSSIEFFGSICDN